MKITGYKSFVASTPWRNLTYIVLETDEGISGIGEARVLGRTNSVLELLRETEHHFIGHDVFDIEGLYQKYTLLDFDKAGSVAITAFSLLEIASWDCIGKKAGLPVYKLLGGKVLKGDKPVRAIPAYANGWYRVERTPDAFAEAAKKVVEKGYKGLKFDPFGAGNLELSRKEYARSIAIIEAVHSVLPQDAQMFIEMHGRFAPHQAIEIARDIEKLKPGWIEEPCRPDDLGALAEVKAHTTIPIATGERLYTRAEYRELFERRCADIIQVDPTNFGLLEAKKVAANAETYSMMVAPHNVGGIISTMVGIHLMAGLRNGKILEHFNDFVDTEVKSIGSPYPVLSDGCFLLAEAPGWGVELDLDYFKKHPPSKTEKGIIKDFGLDMFRDANWQKRAGQRI
ncbi:MAG TPA: mandelate racemase/muconate lactonizing enzyme family protein [Dehalococcoidales bacterium]|nr:mandelate racemase/muconate lactonizing enzyme family protein [Dehalococcoidales bacterium]